LLGRIGCEWEDLQKLVNQDGLEGALQQLLDQGVYLTIDEYKGRQPVVRGSDRFDVSPSQLYNPLVSPELAVRTSGSRGAPTAIPLSVKQMRESAHDFYLYLHARGGLGWSTAVWLTPGSSSMGIVLRYAMSGVVPTRWFSQVDPGAAGLHPRYAWSARVTRLAGMLAGRSIPSPEYVPVRDPEPIARWLAAELREGRTPHIRTFASGAVAIAQAADCAGISIVGSQFTVTGEPVTPQRMAVLQAAGTNALPQYALMEAGPVGYGCLAGQAADDVHVCEHNLALIQPGQSSAEWGLPAQGLFVTSLSPSARLILLNVSTGDQAELRRRECGCPLEQVGWLTHLHTIRSFEKLTAAGMTFADADVIRVLEHVLPARFGGGPTDYQLQEVEGESGRPRLHLVVNPSVGDLDEAALSGAFLDAIGNGSGPERIMGQAWHEWDAVQVVRARPAATGTGKVLHLHVPGRSGD
jgi:hypothetical protein